MLRKLRIFLAVVAIVLVTLLFVDFSGTSARLFGWMAKIQLLPAILSLNFVVIISLLALTLLFGRVYCSVICPLGVMQDIFGWAGKKMKRNRYSYSPALNWLRYTFFGVMIASIACGISFLIALLAPYSAYGRIAESLLQPVWIWGNNLLASWAERHDSYLFQHIEFRLVGLPVMITACLTLVALAFLAFRNGRTYCNTICPVGTILGALSRFAIFRPVIDTSKCNGCGLCSRNCKASCIDSKNHAIDYSRCVDCMDCIGKCRQGAISYTFRRSVPDENIKTVDGSRRQFLTIAGIMGTVAVAEIEAKTVDGGLAEIADKKTPKRATRIVPPGALGIKNLENHCTACQLCVAECPNGVLRPSSDLATLMQPEASYERGYCRPECTRCSNVCPTGAIRPISRADKSSIQIGHAVWVKENCVVVTDGVNCGNCARHCPVGAIIMVNSVAGDDNSPKIPAVNTERCIGCGACENLCPSRPFSAIYVEGHERHRNV